MVFLASTSLPWPVVLPFWMAAVAVAVLDLRGRVQVFVHLERRLSDARIRRQIVHAAEDSGFPGLRVEEIESTLPGELVSVRVPRGKTVEKLEACRKEMRGCLRVPDVRVIPNRDDPSGSAKLSIIRQDSFSSMTDMAWPLMDAKSVSIREPIPFGRDEYGRMVKIRLLARNMMLGGAPDAGKSTALRILAAAAALDPLAKLWMMDAKTGGAEFIHWTPAAEQVIRGRELEEAVEMLAKLEERVEKRGQEIVRRGEVFVCPNMEIDVLMIDELPQFTRTFESDTKAEIAWVKSIREHIWRLIALGRWAGMPVVLSAQKPTADIVPSEFRDLIDYRFGLHCNTRAMSDAIMGAGAGEEAPANAADIPSGQPGVGYLLGDNGVQKMRSFFISHKQAIEISSRVASSSMDDELAAL